MLKIVEPLVSPVVPTMSAAPALAQISNNLVSDMPSLQDGKPMKIKVGFEIAYGAQAATPMIIMLNIHPSRINDIIGEEKIWAEPNVPIKFYRDNFGNICGRLTAPPGGITLFGEAMVRDTGKADEINLAAEQHAIEQLPDDVLLYLLPSRYCETDRLTAVAWNLFKDTKPGWSRVQAINAFVHNRIKFDYLKAHPGKSAHDVYQEQTGVCRDFAHLAVTLCRCMNIPARYVTGYLGDIGVPPDGEPMDFSGWYEVYLSGRWYTCDARHNRQRIGRILMGVGRDAADVALTTNFGAIELKKFVVHTDEVIEG